MADSAEDELFKIITNKKSENNFYFLQRTLSSLILKIT
jgi:hypothetical protein